MEWLVEGPPGLLAGAFFVLALVAAVAAERIGRRFQPFVDDRLLGHLSALQAAVLALLGLLLAFSFGMAADRYEARRALVVKESNAIGTAYLRTDALPAASRTEAAALLRAYVDARLAFYRAGEDPVAVAAAIDTAKHIQADLWRNVMGEAVAAPTSLPLALLVESVNAVIDVHSERVIAHQAHVPDTIVLLLVAVGVVGIALVGFVFGLFRGPYRAPCVILALLTAGILQVIVDLDQPRRGHIRVSQASMERLQESLERR